MQREIECKEKQKGKESFAKNENWNVRREDKWELIGSARLSVCILSDCRIVNLWMAEGRRQKAKRKKAVPLLSKSPFILSSLASRERRFAAIASFSWTIHVNSHKFNEFTSSNRGWWAPFVTRRMWSFLARYLLKTTTIISELLLSNTCQLQAFREDK